MRWTAYEESVSRKEEEMGPVIIGEMIERDPKLKGENGVSICCYWNASRSNETSYYKLEKDIITIIIERENARFEKSSS